MPAAFRRLCVETANVGIKSVGFRPAAFRRLCVETVSPDNSKSQYSSSRLQAAVC